MNVQARRSEGSRGSRSRARARFVIGPRVTRWISPGRRRAASTIQPAAGPGSRGRDGAASSAWPMPRGPWVSSAVAMGLTSGRSAPRATGTSVLPTSSSRDRLLSATWRAGTLPPTQVRPTRSISGDAQAYRMARLSSIPVSTSRRRGRRSATFGMLRAPEADEDDRPEGARPAAARGRWRRGVASPMSSRRTGPRPRWPRDLRARPGRDPRTSSAPPPRPPLGPLAAHRAGPGRPVPGGARACRPGRAGRSDPGRPRRRTRGNHAATTPTGSGRPPARRCPGARREPTRPTRRRTGRSGGRPWPLPARRAAMPRPWPRRPDPCR